MNFTLLLHKTVMQQYTEHERDEPNEEIDFIGAKNDCICANT